MILEKRCSFIKKNLVSTEVQNFPSRIWASRLGFGPRGWNLGLGAGIWAFRLEFGPLGWDLGLLAGIWALRLGSRPLG